MVYLNYPRFCPIRYAWRHQLEALGSTGLYYCVAVDMRGFGESDKPAGVDSYRIELLVQDVVSIVRRLGYDTVVSTSGYQPSGPG